MCLWCLACIFAFLFLFLCAIISLQQHKLGSGISGMSARFQLASCGKSEMSHAFAHHSHKSFLPSRTHKTHKTHKIYKITCKTLKKTKIIKLDAAKCVSTHICQKLQIMQIQAILTMKMLK